MTKLLYFIPLFLFQLSVYADYTGTLKTNQSDLTFTTNMGYDVISLKEPFYTSELGAPQLPVKTVSILIPVDQKVSSVIINGTTLEQLNGTFNLYPVQTPVRTDASNQSLPFDNPNPLIYNSAKPYPNILYEITNDGYPMGYHVVTIKFYPLQYISASKTINLFTTINFTIVYSGNSDNILRPNRQSEYSSNLSKKYVQSMVTNPDDINAIAILVTNLKLKTH